MATKVSTDDLIECGGCGRQVQVTTGFLLFVLREFPRSCSQRMELDSTGNSFLYIETGRLFCTGCKSKQARILKAVGLSEGAD